MGAMRRKKRRKDPQRKAERQRKRMRRPARLTDAREWLSTHQGADVLHDYQRWYSVDLTCAIAELRTLGVTISEELEAQALAELKLRAAAREVRRAEQEAKQGGKRAKQVGKRAKKAGKQAKEAARRARQAERAAAKQARRAAADRPTSLAEAHIDWLFEHGWADGDRDAAYDARWESVPDRYDDDDALPIEYELFDDGCALDLKVVETRVECDGDTVVVRMILEGTPARLARYGWGLIYAIGECSFADADADRHFGGHDRWTVGDMLRHLTFERGRLRFHADEVRGRAMKTTLEINPDGTLTLETVDRGDAALRWIARLRGDELELAAEAADETWMEPLPF
jgi:hypothetical protein